ncbi:MAG: hypothetical protein ACC707_16335 [Thiohalomonadales bacterium]
MPKETPIYGATETFDFVHGLNVSIIHPIGAFGELITAQKIPQVQIKFPYGLNSDIVQTLTNNASSTVTASSGICTVTCAASANAFSQIRTLDVVRYSPGQGSLMQGTCAFTTGVANSSQVFGLGDDEEGFFFGYNGTAYGLLHRAHGELEMRELTITAGADAGGGDFVITMDGTAVTISVNANDTISEVVAAIKAAESTFGNAGRGWEVNTNDNITITFTSLVAENASGTFSFSDTDSGVTAGTFTQATTAIEGLAPTDTWIPQADFNRDTIDGQGASGFTVDPTKLNVYEIQSQYLGAGMIEYSIEDPETGHFISVHAIKYANTAVIASLSNPTLHLTIIAKTETGYSGGALTMKTASMAGFIEGSTVPLNVRFAISNAKTTTGSTPVNILTIHNREHFQGTRNKVVVYPDFITVASEATKTVTIDVISNPTQVDGTVAMTEINAANSVVHYDTAGTTVVGGEKILTIILTGAQSKEIDLKSLNLNISPKSRLVFVASLSSGSNSPVSVGITWDERL